MNGSVGSFREAFPAFADATTWDDATVTMALCEADAETGGRGWGAFEDICSNFKRRGQYLFAAHYLAAFHPSGGSSTAGASKIAVSGKSVGDESITYAVPTYANGGDAWLASTQFGQQFMILRRRAGMGARAV